VSRRQLLQGVGIGTGALVVAGATGIGIRGETNGVWNTGRGAPYDLWTTWQDAPGLHAIVAAGVLAANPHNIQPWSFTIGANSIDLYSEPTRAMPVNDSDGRERMVGFGATLTNMAVAARLLGLRGRVDISPPGNPAHIARLDLASGPASTGYESALAAAISTRHTNRGPYGSRPVAEPTLASLTAQAPAGASVVWITDPARKAALGRLYVDATQAIIDDQQMSIEGFSWFRNDRADIDAYADGLTLDCQGLDAFTLFLAKILPAQSRTDGDNFWLAATRDVHTATAAAYGIIRVPDALDPAHQVAAGRLLEHIHLDATLAGVALQPMNQITECIARDATCGRSDRFSDRWAEIIGFPSGEGVGSFRIGYPVRAANPSPRRPLDTVIDRHR
jgi:hypothetical protein